MGVLYNIRFTGGDNEMNKKIVFASLMIITILAGIGIAYATSYLMASNSIAETPQPKYTLTLATNSTSPVIGVDTVKLTATCTDTAFTGTVTFTSGSTSLGTADAVAGVAILNWTPVAGTFSVVATATHP
jgi:hypothetical protein